MGSGSEAQAASTLVALDALTHQVRWQVALPPLGDDRYFWFSGPMAFAVSSVSGTLLWRTSVTHQSAVSTVSPYYFSAYAGGVLYGADDKSALRLCRSRGQVALEPSHPCRGD